MRTRIARIGDSRGIRIPKPLLEQAGLHEDVQDRVLAVLQEMLARRGAVRLAVDREVWRRPRRTSRSVAPSPDVSDRCAPRTR
jgi:hypothetical protein